MERMLIFGDSYVSAADRGRPGFARLTPLLLGMRGQHMGRGGTGFVNVAVDGRQPYPTRLDDLLGRDADVVVVQASGNDAPCDLDEVRKAATEFLTAARDRFPRVVVLGPMWAIAGRDNLPELRDTMREVCDELGVPFVDGLGWMTPRWIGPDGAHPTKAGHAVLAWRLARALRRVPATASQHR